MRMKKLIQKWLGIFTHPSWEAIGRVLKDLSGDEVLLEKCTSCGMTEAYDCR